MDRLQSGAGILGCGCRAQAPGMCSPTSGKADLTLIMQVESAAAQKTRMKELVLAEIKLCDATPHCVRHQKGPARVAVKDVVHFSINYLCQKAKEQVARRVGET